MKLRQWRLIHRWAGLFIVGFLLFYTITGILLNHRTIFNNFLKTTETVQERKIGDPFFLRAFLAQCRAMIGSGRKPAIIIIKGNVIDYRYDRHGSESVLLNPAAGTITTVTKEGKEPWHGMKWLHVVYRTGPYWVFISDIAATTILLAAVSGLFCFRYRRGDITALLAGVLLFIAAVFFGWPN